MEAENFMENVDHGEEFCWWELAAQQEGFAGTGYMFANETRRRTFYSGYVSGAYPAPELRYVIRFETSGAYRIWLRAFCPETSADTCHVGLNRMERSGNFAQQFEVDETSFTWSGDTRREGSQIVEVPRPGLYVLSIWVRESGQTVDRILLTRDLETAPEGEGPAESDRVPAGADNLFVRGDVDGNDEINISDAVDILLHLFSGEQWVSCEDHGDVDDSGQLNITDAISLLSFLFQGGPPPVEPFPEPGLDETEDAFSCGDAG
jgi:hypothetical protein